MLQAMTKLGILFLVPSPRQAENLTHQMFVLKSKLEVVIQILLQVSMMERDYYLGRILTGRVRSGIVRVGDKVHGLRSTDDGVQRIEDGKV